MFKKFVVIAILAVLIASATLIADPNRDPLYIQVSAHPEIEWTLLIWDGVQSPWTMQGQGTETIDASGCQGCTFEVIVNENVIESGNLPYSDWFEIVIPITGTPTQPNDD